MKKICLIMLAVICSTNIFAKTNGFESNVKLRFDAGVDLYKNHDFGIEYIAGYRFSPYAKLGAGVGVSYINQVYDQKRLSIYSKDEYKEAAAMIPVFINGKFNFCKSGISPYFNLNIGYNIFIPCSEFAKINQLSWFFNPAFGVDFPLAKGAISVEVGYKYNMRKVDANAITWGKTCNFSQIEIGVGYQF